MDCYELVTQAKPNIYRKEVGRPLPVQGTLRPYSGVMLSPQQFTDPSSAAAQEPGSVATVDIHTGVSPVGLDGGPGRRSARSRLQAVDMGALRHYSNTHAKQTGYLDASDDGFDVVLQGCPYRGQGELVRCIGFEASHLSANSATVIVPPATGSQVPLRILNSSTVSYALALASATVR